MHIHICLYTRAHQSKVSFVGKFFGPVVHERSAKEIARHLRDAKDSEKCKILTGGRVDTSVGWFVEPTVIECHDPHVLMMREEIFGPVLCVYVYEDQGDDDDDEFERVVKTLVTQSQYALTGALFARDREVTVRATAWLRDACGNFYINDKCTGAIVGQQPFGGSRQSGTNDKAGSPLNLLRWTSARSVKELFVPLDAYLYASNQPG
jgi:1-pyrroline-5-carboxylate dehydrogenase